MKLKNAAQVDNPCLLTTPSVYSADRGGSLPDISWYQAQGPVLAPTLSGPRDYVVQMR